MNEIIFQIITSTPDGTGLATSGREMQQAFNGNFTIVKRYLDILLDVVSTQVSSENVRQFRVDTSTTPYKVYYSLDDETVENPEWIYLSANFSDLVGEPRDNIALKEELDSKADADVVTDMQGTVLTHTAQISDLSSRVTPLETITATHTTQINTINDVIPHTVRNPNNTLLYLRFNSVERKLEYSINGTNWNNVADTGVSWTDITGNPEDSAPLNRMVNNLIEDAQQAQGGYATKGELLDHTSDTDNPHQVTAEQLGLGNVLDRLDALEGGGQALVDYSLSDFLDLVADQKSYYVSSQFVNQDDYSDWTKLADIDESNPYTTTEGYPVTVAMNPNDPIVYTGRNLYVTTSSKVDNGITFTLNNDGTYNFTGTSTAQANNYNDVSVKESKLMNGETSTLSSTKALPSGVRVMVEGYRDNTWVRHIFGANQWLSNERQELTGPVDLSDINKIRFTLRVDNDITPNMQNYGFQLENGSKTSFEKYVGGKVVYLPKYYKLKDVTQEGEPNAYELYFSQNAKDYIDAHTI